MKKILMVGVTAMSIVGGIVGSASAYEGGWAVRNNPGGREILYLGDNSDNSFRSLRGTGRYCGDTGSSYATMRRVLNGVDDQVTWWEDYTCDDGYVRVCVTNNRRSACSTYIDQGWVRGSADGGSPLH